MLGQATHMTGLITNYDDNPLGWLARAQRRRTRIVGSGDTHDFEEEYTATQRALGFNDPNKTVKYILHGNKFYLHGSNSVL